MWPPSTAEDVEIFLRDGQPEESHHVDFKRVVNTKTDKKELARDLASFAIDGGWLLIGVDEPEPGVFEPWPIDIAGQPERIESIAHSRVDPPLNVETTTLPHQGTQGYLLVRVPPSPQVVHAVDFEYWGRGDKRKVRLADGDVDRLMRLRHSRMVEITGSVRERMQVYPRVSARENDRTRMLTRAAAQTAHPSPLRDVLSRTDGQAVTSMLHKAEDSYLVAFNDGALSPYRPLSRLVNQFPRPGGRTVASEGITAEGRLNDSVDANATLAEIRVLETGTVEVWWERPFGDPRSVFSNAVASDDVVVEGAGLAIALAAASADMWHYEGSWHIGMRVENPQGVVAMTARRAPGDPKSYPGLETYEAMTSCTTRRARDNLIACTEDLVGSFVRALHTHGRFFPREK